MNSWFDGRDDRHRQTDGRTDEEMNVKPMGIYKVSHFLCRNEIDDASRAVTNIQSSVFGYLRATGTVRRKRNVLFKIPRKVILFCITTNKLLDNIKMGCQRYKKDGRNERDTQHATER
jgi:hypothetical protein